MKTLKSLLLGIGVFIIGTIISMNCGFIFNPTADQSFYYAIIFAILYLAGVMSIWAYLIYSEIKKK